MKQSNNKVKNSDRTTKEEELLLKQAKLEWNIIKFVKRGAYFISNPDSLLGLDRPLKK